MQKISILFLFFFGAAAAFTPSGFLGGSSVTASSYTNAPRSGRGSMSMRARICDLTGKTPNRQAMVVTFSHKRNKKVQHVNLQSKKLYWDEGSRYVKIRVSTKGLRTIEKYGLHAAAKKYDMDLSKFGI
mmetsp:Transcript_24386/g.33387  ORF Transcript_24386/g.33387 Transcript_24386/m.33387 type:complete len:129 (-) Transcript_24386:494-880(-)